MSPHAGAARKSGSVHSSKINRLSAAAIAIAAGSLVAPRLAQAQVNTIWNGGYHAQVTDYFCAAASMEMELDVPAVKNTNPFVVNMINAGDGALVPHNGAPPLATLNAGQVTAFGQSFVYGLVHGQNTFNGV